MERGYEEFGSELSMLIEVTLGGPAVRWKWIRLAFDAELGKDRDVTKGDQRVLTHRASNPRTKGTLTLTGNAHSGTRPSYRGTICPHRQARS